MLVSVVVPAFNEVDSVAKLHAELTTALMSLGWDFEILFVDDGSTDGTDACLRELVGADDCCRAFRMPRNRGKSAAYMVGFDAAHGDVVATLDADLQDDPAQLERLLAALSEGADLVVGWKDGRFQNEPAKTIPSRLYNAFKGVLFGLRLRDSNSGFRVMRREVAKSLVLYGGQYRLLPELSHLNGFRVREVPVAHRPRAHGESKYGASRFWTGLLDLATVRFLSGFLHQPLHFFGSLAALPILLGGVLQLYVLAMKVLGSPFKVHLAAMLGGLALLIVGVQILGIGLLGEMIRSFAPNRLPRREVLLPRAPRP